MRYFFDTTVGHETVRDEEGVERATREAARQLAEQALGELLCDELPDGGEQVFRIEVREGESEPIFRAHLHLQTEWLDRAG